MGGRRRFGASQRGAERGSDLAYQIPTSIRRQAAAVEGYITLRTTRDG